MKKLPFTLALLSLLFAVARAQGPAAPFSVPETRDIAMYEVNPRPFSPTGDLKGVAARLDQIEDLGINVIWLMPIYPLGRLKAFGSPYCVRDYLSVDPSLGTVDDLRDLIARAHERGIAVILDWVANHSSWDNPWITAHPDWYTHDASGRIVHPAGTEWNDVADLDYGNADMRRAMIGAMEYWAGEVGVDGFRCDAADYVPFDFWRQAIGELQAPGRRRLILLAEGARNDHFAAGFQMDFAWGYLDALKGVFASGREAWNLMSASGLEYASVPPGGEKLRFTTNHDESGQRTPVSVFGGTAGALAASAATILMRGVPLIYCGQEVGVASAADYGRTGSIRWDGNPGMLQAYAALLGLYRSSRTIREAAPVVLRDPDVVAFTKSLGGDQVLVLVNARAAKIGYAVPGTLRGSWKDALTGKALRLGPKLSLRPYQYLILDREEE